MDSNDITKFSDNVILNAPQRQPIYRVEPKSVDGKYAECMSSYLGNMAAEHGTSPAIFLQQIIPVAAAEFRDDRRGSFAVQSFPQRIDGTSEYAVRFSQMLSRLSGVENLDNHTLKAFSPITSKRGFLRKSLAWCPQFIDSVTKPYIPILWRLAWVKVCPRFRVPLHSCCPSCGKPVAVLCGRGNVGHCTHYDCQADLSELGPRGVQTTTLGEIKSMDYEVWIAEQTEILLSDLRTNPLPESFVWSDVINFWLRKFKIHGKRGVGPRIFGIDGTSLSKWQKATKTKNRPTMQHLFNFAWVMQLSVTQFLHKELPENHNGQLVPSLMSQSKEKTAPKRPIDRPKVLSQLRKIIDEDLYPYESFTQIAKRIGRRNCVLYQTFPDEAKYLGQRFKMNRKVKARLQKAADQAEILEACTIIAEMNEVISARRVKALVSKPSKVVDPKLGGALIQEARRQQIEKNSRKFSSN